MNSDTPRPAAELVEHWTWTRRLAGHLVGDPALADDLAQDTWLRASRHPGVEPTRGFLGAVVRNLVRERARGERHRADRERSAASSRTSPAPDEILAAAETGQALAAAVLELPAAARDVLLMRYFEGMSSVRIAEKLKLPEGTVRSRIKRALDALRTRFEGTHGHKRLMALAGVPGAAAAGVAGAAKWSVLRVAGMGATAAAILWVAVAAVSARGGVDTVGPVVARRALVVDSADDQDLVLPSGVTERGAVAASAEVVEIEDVPRAAVIGKLVDEWHRPIANATVTLAGDRRGVTRCTDRTASDGTFRLESNIAVDSRVDFRVDAGPHRANRSAVFAPGGVGISRALEVGERDLGEIIVPPRGSVRARVVGLDGEPLVGIQMLAFTASGSFLTTTETDASGGARLERLPVGATLIRAMDSSGRATGEAEVEVLPGLAMNVQTFIVATVEGDEPVFMDFEESEGDPDFTSDRAVIVRGRIVRSGSGVPGVPVLIRRLRGRDAEGKALGFMSTSVDDDLEAVKTLWHNGATTDHVRTDAEGWFELESDQSGAACEVIASTETHHVRVITAPSEQGAMDLGALALVRYASVTLRILAPEGLSGWEFECRPTALDAHVAYASDSDGLLRLPPLPAGLHTLSLRPIQDRLAEGVTVRVDLQPGETRTVDIDARAFGICRVELRSGAAADAFPRGSVIFAPKGVRMPFRVKSQDRQAAAFEAVTWRTSDAPKKTVFVRAIGLVDVGFVDMLGRSVRFGDRAVELRSGGRIDVTLDLGRTATLDLAFPRGVLPGREGMVSVECAGGTTLAPVREGQLEPVAWGVERMGRGRLRIRGLAAGETQVRVRITDFSAWRERADPAPGPLPVSTMEAAVTLAIGRASTLDLTDIQVLPGAVSKR